MAERRRPRRRRLRRRDRRAAALPPPVLRAGARDRAGGGRPAARRRPPAHARAAGARGLRRRRGTPSTRPSSPTRTARRRRSSPSCARAGTRVVDLSADFRLRDRAIYDDWYGEHKAPELLRAGRLRAAGAHARRGARAPTSSPTRAATRPPRCSGWRRWRAPGVIGDVVIDAKSGVSGAGRAPTHATHFISANENVSPYKITGHRHTPEIEQELGVLGATLPITFMPHLLPLDQGELVSCYVTPTARAGRGRAGEPVRRRLRARAVRRAAHRAGRRDRRARHELLPHLVASRTRGRAGSSSSRRSTTCGRARRRRPCRT